MEPKTTKGEGHSRKSYRLQIPATGNSRQEERHVLKNISGPGFVEHLVAEDAGVFPEPLCQRLPEHREAVPCRKETANVDLSLVHRLPKIIIHTYMKVLMSYIMD